MSTRTTQGILPYQQIKQLIANHAIHTDMPIEDLLFNLLRRRGVVR